MVSSGERPDAPPSVHDGVEHLVFVDYAGEFVQSLVLLAEDGLYTRERGRWNAADHAALDDMLVESSPVRVVDSIVEVFDAVAPAALSWDVAVRYVLELETAASPARAEQSEVGESITGPDGVDIWSILLNDDWSTDPDTVESVSDDTTMIEADEDDARSLDDELLRNRVPDAARAINSAGSIVDALAENLQRRRVLQADELDLFDELRTMCAGAAIETIAAAANFLQTAVFREADSAVVLGKSQTDVVDADEVDPLNEYCLDIDDLALYVRETVPERGMLVRRIWERMRYDAVLTVLAHDGDEDVDAEAVLVAALEGFLEAGLGDEASRAANALLETGESRASSKDFGDAASAIEHARSGFERLDSPGRVADCALALVEVYLEAGWDDDAESVLIETVIGREELIGDDRVADCMRQLGALYRRAGRHEEAEQSLLQARSLFVNTNAETSVAECNRQLSAVYESMCLYADAEIAALAARDGYAEIGSMNDVADAERDLGFLYRTMGRFDHSDQAFRRALVACESRSVGERTAQQHHDLGVLYAEVDRFDDAERSFVHARAMFVELVPALFEGFDLDVAECDRNLGGVYLEMFRAEDAVPVLVSALEVFERCGAQDSRASDCSVKLGNAFRELGQFEEAEVWFEAARGRSRLLGDSELEATCVVSLGGLRSAMGDSSGAEKAYLAAREVFSNLGSRDQVADIDVRLGIEYVQADLPSAARRAFRRARETFAVLGMSARASDCTHQLGMLGGPADLAGFRSADDEPTALLADSGGDRP